MDRVLMCSVSPYEYNFQRTYNNNLHIPKCESGKPFASVWIEDGLDNKMVYQGLKKEDREQVPVGIPALQIATDLLVNGELEREGVWICLSGKPTNTEIEKAQDTRMAWLLKCVSDGDKIYARVGSRGLDQIPDFMKRAVTELGEERDWVLSRATPKIECDGCGTMVRTLRDGSAPAYCPSCKSVLNEAKATELAAKAQRITEPAAPKPTTKASAEK